MHIADLQVKMDSFVSRWQIVLWEACKGDNQKTACWYLWVRFLLGLRSLHHLFAVNDIPGCYTIARGCLEYDVAISAIVNDASLGDRYMNYDAHGRNRYLQAARFDQNQSDEKIDAVQNYMISRFGPDFPTKKKASWHEGFPKLLEIADRRDESQHYIACCQLVHGTITGMQYLNIEGLLNNQPAVPKSCQSLLMYHTCGFFKASNLVANLIFGSLWSPDKHKCMSDLDHLGALIAHSTEHES